MTLILRAGRLLFLLTFLAFSGGQALKRQPGRGEPANPAPPQFQIPLQFPAQSGQVIPGLFELIPSGLPDKPVWPGLLYHPATEAQTGEADYFSKRIDVPVSGAFWVVGLLVLVPPGSAQDAVTFAEISINPEARGGGPDLTRVALLRTNVAADPGISSLLIDISADQFILSGPARLYVTFRFPPGKGAPGRMMLDTDQDLGLFPQTNFISTGGGPFLSFEKASETVRPSFYGLEDSGPPGIGADCLVAGLYIYTDPSAVPQIPPDVEQIEPGQDNALRVKLIYNAYFADGRAFAAPAQKKVRVYHQSVRTLADSLIGEYSLDSQGWIEVAGLKAHSYLLRFAALDGSGKAGLAGGAHLALPYDSNESNDSPLTAVSLEWGQGSGPLLPAEGEIASALDFDFYRLELARGDSLVVGFRSPSAWYSPLDPLLSLLDSSGLVLGYAEGPGARVSRTADYSGTHYLLVNDRAILEGGQFGAAGGRVYGLSLKKELRRGDIDGDGDLDYRDAFLVYLLVSGLQDTLDATAARRLAADFNGNGVVAGDQEDFLLLLRAITTLPGRNPETPDKNKGQPEEEQLAGALNWSWRLVCPDGSSLKLALDQPPALGTPGRDAFELLELAARLTGSPGIQSGLPQAAVLGRNTPNPFNPSTEISFSLAGPGWARLEVFDLRGKKVRTLLEGSLTAGAHRIYWDGTTESGAKLPSGIYFYSLRFGATVLTRKMVLLK